MLVDVLNSSQELNLAALSSMDRRGNLRPMDSQDLPGAGKRRFR